MKVLKLVQGTPEWNAARNTTHNASEAAAMQGLSKYKSRDQLIREKATGIVEEVSPEKQALFDRGHAAEAAARPLVEEMIGDSLYPMTATDDDSYLGASSDGATLPPKGGIGLEHKLWNEKLAALVRAGTIPETHTGQLDQTIAVFGFEKIIFVVSDGTPDKFVSCEYRTTPERIAALIAGWKQFDEDVAAYVPEVIEAKPVLVAKSIENLPALHIELTGRVSASNLVEFKSHATAVISSINTSLQTDQDFVDAKKAVKYLEDVEDNAKRAKANALAQTTSIDELFKALDEVITMAADVRKNLDKKIKEETANRKTEMVMAAKNELVEHVQKLNKRLGGLMQDVTADFALVIKGLSSIDSMKSKIAAALAGAKITANEIADRIDTNVKLAEDWRFLFPDLRTVCAKATDDFAALLDSRVAAHKAVEEKRLEDERARIRKEEQDRADREAAAKIEADRKEQARLAKEASDKAEADRKAEAAKNTPPPAALSPEPEIAPVPVQQAGEDVKNAAARAQLDAMPIAAPTAAVVSLEPADEIKFVDQFNEATDLMASMDNEEIARVVEFCKQVIAERPAAAA